MFPLNKLVIICGLFIIIQSAYTTNTKGFIEYKNIRVGTIINRNQRNKTSIEVFSSIFNENSTYPEVYTSFTELVRYPPKWRSRQFNCMESVQSLTHPAVKTHSKFSSNNSIDRSFYQLEDDLIELKKLDIGSKYANTKHVCILSEICNLKEEKMKKDVHVIDEDDLPLNINEYKYLTVKKAVLKTKQGVESDYVSSITKGTCLAQISVYVKDDSKDILLNNYADKKPVFESPLVSATNNTELEKWTTDFLKKARSSLLNFEKLSAQNQTDIFKRMESDAIRDFSFVRLPELQDKIQKTTPSSKLWKELLPGDTLNMKELNDSSVAVIQTMFSTRTTRKIKYNSEEDLSVTIRTFNNGEKFESCPFEQLSVRSSDHVNDHQGLEMFDCKVQSQQFGVPDYMKEGYKRMEVRVCRTVEKESMKEPVTVINWHKDYSNIGYNVFNNENIILRYPTEGETHYVSAVHRGDCLYQALVYDTKKEITDKPIFISKLIAASDNNDFKTAVENLLSKAEQPSIGLHQVVENESLKSKVKDLFEKNTVLSIDLRSLRAERPRPQPNLFKFYYNFGNSLQASLLTFSIILVVTKFFTS